MKDSMWSTHPDAALRVMLESFAKDEGNGKANALHRKGKRGNHA